MNELCLLRVDRCAKCDLLSISLFLLLKCITHCLTVLTSSTHKFLNDIFYFRLYKTQNIITSSMNSFVVVGRGAFNDNKKTFHFR